MGNPTNRRYLEVCVFSHLASDLRCGDVCIEGAGTFADYRDQLMPWDECETLLTTYCDRVGIPADAQSFVDHLRKMATDTAAQVDNDFPQHAGDVAIGANGEPTLKHVIEGLMKAQLSVQADTVYSDTHGQSEAVFAFTYLNGIQLMPRIRNWKDLKFYKPEKGDTLQAYRPAVFRRGRLEADPQPLEGLDAGGDLDPAGPRGIAHVAAQVEPRRPAQPPVHCSARTRPRAAHGLPAALDLAKEMRQEVTATTNKIESYHAFTKWLDFGGDVIAENDLNEQQKRVRYIDLVASAVILQNTVDMMRIMQDLHIEGKPFSAADAAFMSPYGTTGVKRFGNYHLDLKRPPEPWVKESLFRQAVKRAREETGKGRGADNRPGA